MSWFRVHKKFIIRHKILGFLKYKVDRKLGVYKDLNLSNTDIYTLSEKIGVDCDTINEYHYALHAKDQIRCFVKNDKHIIGIEEKGMADYTDEYWLREGQKDLNERIYDKTKWLVPVIALILTSGSTLYSIVAIQSTKNKVLILEEKHKIIAQELQKQNDILTKRTDSLYLILRDTAQIKR